MARGSLAVGLLLLPAALQANPGSLDPTFGAGGTVTTPIGSGVDEVQTIVRQPDGKLIAAGDADAGAGLQFALVRYLPDGTLDPGFGTGGVVTTVVGAGFSTILGLALQPDGRIVAAGSASNGHDTDFALARYEADGSLDTSFGTGGVVVTAFGTRNDGASAVALMPDGGIVAAGGTRRQFFSDIALARYEADGRLDPTFGTGGMVTTSFDDGTRLWAATAGVVVQADGKVVVAGYRGRVLDGTDFSVAVLRYDTAGTLDSTFGSGGETFTAIGGGNSLGQALVAQPDGALLVAASATNPGGGSDVALVRYASDGSLDPTFGSGGTVQTDFGLESEEPRDVALAPDGKIVVAGIWFDLVTSTNRGLVARYDADGSLDPSFGSAGLVADLFAPQDAQIVATVMQPDGKPVVAGYASNGTDTDFALARLANNTCGNGVGEPDEQCDDGALNGTPGSCCDAGCRFQPAGTACATGVCDGADACRLPTTTSSTSITTTSSSTTVTTTSSSTSTTTTTTVPCACASPCETCVAGLGCVVPEDAGCVAAVAHGATVDLRRGATDVRDALAWSWKSAAPVDTADFGDPVAAGGMTLCVLDRPPAGPATRLRLAMPAGARWRASRIGFRYRSGDATPDGIVSATLASGAPRRAHVRLRGTGANLHLPDLDLTTPVTVRLQRDDGGACWEATFTAPRTRDAARFRARSD